MSFKLRNLLPGIHKTIVFIMRDETLHFNFLTALAVELIREEPGIWDEDTQTRAWQIINEVLTVELAFVDETIGEGIPNLSAANLKEHILFLAQRRISPLGLQSKEAPEKSPVKWLSEVIETEQEGNFFETTVHEYRKGGLSKW